MSFIMLISLVGAISLPLPINGKVIGDFVSNLQIKVENLRTGEILNVLTSDSGEYLAEGSNFGGTPPLLGGDIIRVTIVSCSSNPKCVQQVKYTGQSEIFMTFDLTGEDIGVEPDPTPDPIPTPTPVDEENKVTPSDAGDIATTTAFFGQIVDIKLDDNKLNYLFDGEIELDGESYDAKEEAYINILSKTSIDDDDFGLEPRLTFEELAFEYRFILEDFIDLTEITEEDSLTIPFLGNEIEIIKASENEITVRYGTEGTFEEGETDTLEGNEITVMGITESLVSLIVNGASGSVSLSNSKEIGGIDVLVDEIFYQGYAGGVKTTVLIVGDTVQETYKDGDFFDLFVEDEEIWEWIIQLGGTDQYLGVWNVESYQSIDEDEEFMPLSIGESFYFPNNYIEVKFKSVTPQDTTSLKFKVDDGFLNVRGTEDNTFSFGTKEYDEVNIDSTGIYDEDMVLITTDKIEISDSDIFLETGSVKIGEWTIELDLSDILYKTISYLTEDEIFMDYFGIVVYDPEQAIEDKKGLKITVPDDRPELVIAFGKDIPVEIVTDPTVCPKANTTDTEPVTCPDTKTIIEYQDKIIIEEKIVYKDTPCPDCPKAGGDGNVGALIITFIASLLIGGASGVYFTRNRVLGRRGGLKIYMGKDGEEKTLHKHPGVKSYHDPATKHQEDHEEHPKGQLFPHYTYNEEEERYEYDK